MKIDISKPKLNRELNIPPPLYLFHSIVDSFLHQIFYEIGAYIERLLPGTSKLAEVMVEPKLFVAVHA